MAGASDERPGASAIGSLATRPLVHLLVYARNRRLTGQLELHAPDGRGGSLSLWRGRIHDARTQPASAYFGTVAYELGYIDTATHDATLLEISKSKRLHGEVLVERGALTPLQRDQILVEQTCRKVHFLFSLPPEGSFAFYDAVPGVVEPPFTLDTIRPTWMGLRAHPPMESVREVLARFASSTLRMANEGPIVHAGLDADEGALCEALSFAPMTLAQLRATSKLPAERVELLFYLLVITKCVEPVAAGSAAASASPVPPAVKSSPALHSSPSSASIRTVSRSDGLEVKQSLSFRVPSAPGIKAASGSSPRLAAQPTALFSPADLGAIGIAHRASAITREDPFTVLGLPRDSSVEAARAMYFRLAKLWHPDRLPADLAPFRAEAESIFDHMTRAHHTLTDPDARKDFLAGKAPTAAPARPRNEVIREIEQALAKREFHMAEATARQLVAANSDDAQAQALVAWATTLGGEASEDTLRAALPALDRAVHLDRDCEAAHYYRGIVHKRLHNNVAAFRDFTRVVQLNPKHVDAQREVRIFEMRSRKGSGEHALDLLIAKKKK